MTSRTHATYKTIERVTVETTKVPETVTLTMDADVFVGLIALWSAGFGGWDGVNGIRHRTDRTMSAAWDAVFPGVKRPPIGVGDATERAQAMCDAVLGVEVTS